MNPADDTVLSLTEIIESIEKTQADVRTMSDLLNEHTGAKTCGVAQAFKDRWGELANGLDQAVDNLRAAAEEVVAYYNPLVNQTYEEYTGSFSDCDPSCPIAQAVWINEIEEGSGDEQS